MSHKVPVRLTANLSHLSEKDLVLLRKLREIAEVINRLYRKQISEEGTPTFYPTDLTATEFKKYLEEHPEQEEKLTHPHTVVVRDGDALRAVPYSEAYAEEISATAKLLREAADLCDDARLKQFLLARATGLETNDLVPSEHLWIALDSGPFELTVGAYEEYDDILWAAKRSFEIVVGVMLPEENAKLSKYVAWAAEFDQHLAKIYGYQPNSAKRTMVIIDEVAGGGYAVSGFVPQAYNLPNDTSIKQEAGSKQVFVRNTLEAKFNQITRLIATRLVSPEIASSFNSEDRTRATIGHELAHGLGVYCKDGLRELGHVLEEAKADVFGMLMLYWLADHGRVSKRDSEASGLALAVDGLRQMRMGQTEAHAVGAVIQYRWLMYGGAIQIKDGRLVFDIAKMREGREKLGDAFAHLATSKNYDEAKLFLEKWSQPIPELEPLLAQLTDIPIDIIPVFED